MTTSVSANVVDSPNGGGHELARDPALLTEQVKALIEEHKHIHPPELARLLNVPEAALVASAIGAGATRLQVEPAKILAGISDWGSVLCVFGSECGSFMPLGLINSIDFQSDGFWLKADHLSAQIETSAISDVYLLIEQDDMHGNTRSLQFFDGAGDPVLKVYIFHKTKFKAAQVTFDALTSDDQSRAFSPADLPSSTFDPQALSKQSDSDTESLAILNSKEILGTFLEPGARFEIECLTRFARALWCGNLNKIRMDENMVHLHEEDIRAHLRFDAFKQWHYTNSGGLSAQDDSGRLLRLVKLS
jgi:putative heme iron utilization protein